MAPQTTAKRIGFLRKKPGMSKEAFLAHWQGTHAVLCQRLPGLRRYCINFIDRDKYPKAEYDGFSELWFDSAEAHDAAFASPEGVELLADAPNFASDLMGVLALEERFVWP